MHNDPQITYPDPGFWTKTSLIQLFYGVMVNLTSITTGLAYSFTAVLIPQLEAPGSLPKVTLSNESWIVSVLPLAILFGNLTGGFLMDRYGRRLVLSVCQVPMSIGWLFTGSARTVKDLIIGRLIMGVGAGMGMGPPRAYVTEIALPNMRGVICALPNLGVSVGIAIEAALGSFMDWHHLAYFNGTYSVVLFLVSFLFPETPYFVLMKDTEENTVTALKKFRSSDYNVSDEIEQMLEFKHDNNIRRLKFKEQLKLLFTKAACKPYWTVAIYIVLSQCSGTNVVMMWAIDMLHEAKSSLNPASGNVVLAFTRLCTSLCMPFIMLRSGRRPLALISSFGVCVACFALGIFLKQQTHPSPVPPICFVIYVLFASLGYYPLPVLVLFELSPLQIRGLLGGITIATVNITIFVINKSFLNIKNALGLSNIILMFGLFSFIATVYIYFFLPETKELTLQEIEEFYNDRRPTLTSQRRIVSMQALSRHDGNMESRSLIRMKPFPKDH